MDRQGLPGIESLFREQERLAKKLSQEELNSLRRYLHKAVHTECESVVARMRFLQSAQEVNEAQYQHALSTLQKDLHVQQTIAGEFRREFGSLARVLQAREVRQKARHDTLVRQIVKGRDEVQEAVKTKENLEAELQQKEKELNQQKDMVVDLEDQLANHKDCDKLSQLISQLNKDLLKAKFDNDKLRKKLAELTTKLDKHTSKTYLLKPISDKHSTSPKIKHHVRFAPAMLAPKDSPVTFTPVTPYCTSNTCRARQDLEECRAQFIKKCEEVVYLKTALAEQKTKTSRERHPAFAVNPSSDKPSAAVQPLKPAYPKGKDVTGLARGSPCTNNARLCASMKFKLGPVLPTMDKK